MECSHVAIVTVFVSFQVLLKLGRPQEAVLNMAWSQDYMNSNGGLAGGLREDGHPHPIDNLEDLDDEDFVVHSDP